MHVKFNLPAPPPRCKCGAALGADTGSVFQILLITTGFPQTFYLKQMCFLISGWVPPPKQQTDGKSLIWG